ncbi:HORMA domain protein, putative [Plasmodium gallinaceum]|uniref:HORMA domain protein, putative n=1 Tax=Plasmodium gallinaceum TaxID=5849 RepID=A0A1J1GY41_PLAGA|nr:HORMA domain protein, putative [Plasmodium gallinaceum]CRG97482.1 HORMA domain protein, putative [Plasmodium gallinaceum]
MSVRTHTQNEALTKQDSVNMLKNIIKLGISLVTYLRNLFEENAYEEVCIQELKLKRLLPINPQANMIINWLEKGVFDAIEKEYLRILILDINDIYDNTIECYKFSFSYNTIRGGEIGISLETSSNNNNNSNNDFEEKKNNSNINRLKNIKERLLNKKKTETSLYLKKDAKEKTYELLRSLVLLTQTLNPLPEKTYLSMKLLYYDEIVPTNYQPPYFRNPDSKDLLKFINIPNEDYVGKIDTGHHFLSIIVNTTCNSLRYNDSYSYNIKSSYNKQKWNESHIEILDDDNEEERNECNHLNEEILHQNKNFLHGLKNYIIIDDDNGSHDNDRKSEMDYKIVNKDNKSNLSYLSFSNEKTTPLSKVINNYDSINNIKFNQNKNDKCCVKLEKILSEKNKNNNERFYLKVENASLEKEDINNLNNEKYIIIDKNISGNDNINLNNMNLDKLISRKYNSYYKQNISLNSKNNVIKELNNSNLAESNEKNTFIPICPSNLENPISYIEQVNIKNNNSSVNSHKENVLIKVDKDSKKENTSSIKKDSIDKSLSVKYKRKLLQKIRVYITRYKILSKSKIRLKFPNASNYDIDKVLHKLVDDQIIQRNGYKFYKFVDRKSEEKESIENKTSQKKNSGKIPVSSSKKKLTPDHLDEIVNSEESKKESSKKSDNESKKRENNKNGINVEHNSSNINSINNDIQKLYDDVYNLCLKTKYVNKDIITKGLGIHSLLSKPLLDRLIKEGVLKKKFIKNKGYESKIYVRIENNFNKRKHTQINKSNTPEKNSPIKKRTINNKKKK